MTNSSKMTRSINAHLSGSSPVKSAGSLSMISMLAISVGMAAAPAQAQEMAEPAMIAPVQAPPAVSPQPAPTAPPTMAPTIAAPPASSPTAVKTETASPVTPDRADEMARKGGFNPETVAPEALAQIEREQQERKAAAAAKAVAASAKAPVKTSGRATSGSTATSSALNANAGSMIAAQNASATSDEMPTTQTFGAESAAGTVAASPTVEPAPEIAASPDALSGESGADWGLLAALAALLGVGGAGAYAATRRRKSKDQAATAVHHNDPLPDSLNAAIMPELRRDRVEQEVYSAADAEQAAVQSLEKKATTKAGFAEFVSSLPAFEAPLGKADRSVTLGQRRVAAAPRPYLAETDLSRTAGYFAANVDAMPTPQNPFLTRQKRLKRARFLDGKLNGTKAPNSKGRARVTGKMEVSRPLEPAYS